jgi:hypothetical protein
MSCRWKLEATRRAFIGSRNVRASGFDDSLQGAAN